jgi:hypothetical protein
MNNLLYLQLINADCIRVDGRIFHPFSIHPNNGLEGFTINPESRHIIDYTISIKALAQAKETVDGWQVSFLQNDQPYNATILCFTHKRMDTNTPVPLQQTQTESIDKKFTILAVNPITGSIHTDASALLLCAKDKATPAALAAYLNACIDLGAGDDQVNSVKKLIERVEQFQLNNPTTVADVSAQESQKLLA